MDKIDITKRVLAEIGLPDKQQSNLCALTIIALAGLRKRDSFSSASNPWMRIHDIIVFVNTNYGVTYAENSRETFRKQALHHFRTAAIIEDNGMATNSPNYRYRLTTDFLAVLKIISISRQFPDTNEKYALQGFLKRHQSLKEIYASKKKVSQIPITINNKKYNLSTGNHNVLQKAIIEDFAPRFAPGAECLYVGDSSKRDLVTLSKELSQIGITLSVHDKMPDVILFRDDKKWIYFIEAVDSVGPMTPARIREIESMSKKCRCGKIYVTAFQSFAKFKKFSDQLAWETEVWIAEMPDHMIHLNGDKFMGPH